MNKNQRNKAKRKTKRTTPRISNNSNSNVETLNKERIKEEKNNNNKILEKKISYPPQIGEIICKIIIDKLITISVRNAENIEKSPMYQNYYFNYLEIQIKNLFSLNNIFFTEEPENENFDYSKYWNTSYNKENTWIEIKEPNSSKCDRFEGVFVKHIPLDKDNSDISNDLIKQGSELDSPLKNNNNIKDDINDFKNKNRKNFKNYGKGGLESLEEIDTDSGDEEHIQSKEKRTTTMHSSINKTIKEKGKQKKIEINLKESFSLENNYSKKKKFEKVEFDSEDIPGINQEFNFDKFAPPEIEILRKDYEKEMKEKNEQFKILNQRRHSFLNKGIFAKEKHFNSEKLTFDSNGQIIKFKPLNINILVNDFLQLKHKMEIIKPLKKLSLIKKTLNRIKTRNNSIKTIKNEIIKNPADNPDLNRGLFIKVNPEKKAKIIQSGNNFGLMLPNVGVVIKAETKVKKGNREFSKFFKKYSLEDYDKILKDYLPKENKELVRNQLKRMQSISGLGNNNLMVLSMNNRNNFYNNSFDFPNSPVNQDNQENEIIISSINSPLSKRNSFKNINKNNLKNMTLNNSSIMNNNFNNSSMTNRSNNLHIFNSNQNGFIRLKNISSSSLKLELDSLNDLELKNQIFSPKNSRKKLENIFSNQFKNIFKKEKKENEVSKDLNDLNKRIISDVGWGSNISQKNTSSQNLLHSKRHNKSQMFRELGNNFLKNFKIKLPRERKTNIFM